DDLGAIKGIEESEVRADLAVRRRGRQIVDLRISRKETCGENEIKDGGRHAPHGVAFLPHFSDYAKSGSGGAASLRPSSARAAASITFATKRECSAWPARWAVISPAIGRPISARSPSRSRILCRTNSSRKRSGPLMTAWS